MAKSMEERRENGKQLTGRPSCEVGDLRAFYSKELLQSFDLKYNGHINGLTQANLIVRHPTEVDLCRPANQTAHSYGSPCWSFY